MIKYVEKYIEFWNKILKSINLIFNLSIEDVKKKFTGTSLGVFWAILNPILTILVYVAVFKYGFRSGSVEGAPFILWFILGIIPWLFISEAFVAGAYSLQEYSFLVKKMAFDVEVIPFIKIASSAIIHSLFVVIAVVISSLYGYYPKIHSIQLLYYFVCSIIVISSFSYFFSAMSIFFKDLNQVINIILLIGMWGTPIAWNPVMFPESAQRLLKLNPLYYIVYGYRESLVYNTWFFEKPLYTIYFWVSMIAVNFISVLVFKRIRPHFSDLL